MNNSLLALPAIAYAAFDCDDDYTDAAISEIIRLGGYHLTDYEFEHCAEAARDYCGMAWPNGRIARRRFAAHVYQMLKPLRKPLNSRDL